MRCGRVRLTLFFPLHISNFLYRIENVVCYPFRTANLVDNGTKEGQIGEGCSVVLGQNRVVLVASVVCFQKIFGLNGLSHQSIKYWVTRGRYWLVLSGTGSKQGGTGCQHDELSQNIWFA